MYNQLSEEKKQIIRDKNLKYYYNNKEKVKQRTDIYFKEYYKKNLLKMLEKSKTAYRKIKYNKSYDNKNEHKLKVEFN